MARVLFAWELGAGLGHLNRMLQVARNFQRRRHQVFMVVQDLSKVHQVAHPEDNFLWFQAPVWLPPLRDRPPAASYAEILFFTGFLDPGGLLGLVRGWHALFAAIQPDLLVCDHAPVSLLSARSTPFKKVTLGTGFFHPPNLAPIPPFRVWEQTDSQRVKESEAKALDTCNQVLRAMGQAALSNLHELFSVDACFLTSWPEFDHYANRPAGNHVYVGPLTETSSGRDPVWPRAGGKRIFAYLKAEYTGIEHVLDALSRSENCVLAYVSGASDQLLSRYASSNLMFSKTPLSLDAVLEEANAVICHAGMGTVSTALRAGCPSLNLPLYAEQRIIGERVAELGYGICVSEKRLEEDLPLALHTLLHNPELLLRTKAFQNTQTNYSAEAITHTVVEQCELLMKQRAANDR